MYTPIIRDTRPGGEVMQQNRQGELEYLTFPGLEKTGIVRHLFTTRTGGVSQGMYSSLNLSFTRGDDPECVTENYRRIGKLMGCVPDKMVCSDQTHTTNIRLVTEKDGGKGVLYPKDYQDIDGLITDTPGLALSTFYADCVPLYFVDTEHRAIGLAHSGWRGTVGRMGKCMVQAMKEHFGTLPEQVHAAIGPSICQQCYEVSEDVAEAFKELLEEQGAEELLREITQSESYHGDGAVLKPGRETGKYQLDLWLANLLILCQAGIPLQQIEVTDICTCHNPEYLFSHRASQGKRGNLGAFLMLKENS